MNPNDASANILIVDDTPANLRLVSKLLRENGYQVRAVANGPRALATVAAHPPDLILLDIRMPGMDGYEVCARLKANPQTADIPVIFLSALAEIQDKVKAFETGGIDYIPKPFQLEEVLARVGTHLSLRRLQRNLQEANQRMQRELLLAAQVQASMMRRSLPHLPGWQLVVELLPAKLTCGDFFDVIPLPDGRAAILIADVVDKGVGAALYMSMSCTLLRTVIADHPDHPAQVLNTVNHRILEDTETDQFVTVFLGILDPATGSLVYSNAGHNPPMLARAGQHGVIDRLDRTGPVLGILEDAAWKQRQIQLGPGDVLLLYTDGITDAENLRQEYFGAERLANRISALKALSAKEIQQAILAGVQEFTGDAPQFDDIALMVLKRHPS
jgi:serine phosphatase RsbU (regulator of sigma subunit)